MAEAHGVGDSGGQPSAVPKQAARRAQNEDKMKSFTSAAHLVYSSALFPVSLSSPRGATFH
jgi:hypothetical protein